MPLAPRPTAAAAVPHPVHALLGAFPVTCFTGTLLTDIVYARTADPQWTTFSSWLLAIGLIAGGLAILAGIAAWLSDRAGYRAAGGSLHGIGTLVAMLLALWNVFVHSRDGWTSVVPTGLTLSVVTVLVLAVTGIAGYRASHRTGRGVML